MYESNLVMEENGLRLVWEFEGLSGHPGDRLVWHLRLLDV